TGRSMYTSLAVWPPGVISSSSASERAVENSPEALSRWSMTKKGAHRKMSNGSGRFMFAGHATGVAARFHKLDNQENHYHVVPMQGSSVVPVSGGRSNHLVEGYRFDVDVPRQRCLIQVDRVATLAEGRDTNGSYETEVSAEVSGLHVVDKLHCDF